MNLSELITLFKELSGRHNLTDAKITRWLNRGGDRLASMLQAADAKMYVLATLEEGKNYLDLSQYLKSVDDIWLINDHTMKQLRVWSNYEDFIEKYSGTTTSGTPKDCVKVPRIRIDSSALIVLSLESDGLILTESEDFLSGPDFGKDTIEQWLITHGQGVDHLLVMFNCPVDKDYHIRATGHTSINNLVEDSDENWMSIRNPDLLVWTAMMYMERDNKNWEAYKNLRSYINDETRDFVIASTITEVANWDDTALEID